MATDTFTGGGTAFIDWTSLSAWSTGALPGTGDTVSIVDAPGSTPLQGLASLETGNYSIAALELQTGVSFSISGNLNVTGNGSVTSTGSIVVSSTGSLTDNNAGNSDTVNMEGGTFTDTNAASNDTVSFTPLGGTFVFSSAPNPLGQVTFGGSVAGINLGGTVDVINTSGVATSGASVSGHQLDLTFGTLETYAINFSASTNMNDLLVTTSATNSSEYVITFVCFASGTRIKTTRGEVAVEDLAVGDLAVTASGEARPIVWLGHKRVERPPHQGRPVRVKAGAFGEGLPCRDLLLSPGHAICVDVAGEVFVPVSELINDLTIVREDVAEVTYWHIELESHDVLLAEGLGCESYMDAGNRGFFGREYGRLAEVDPARVAESLNRYARPFVDGGPIVAAIRQRLAARAEMLCRLAAKVSAAA